MTSIYDRAWAGTLEADDLTGHEEIDSVNPKTKLTPLGAAVWKGYVTQIDLLLRKGANPNGADGARPPLWVAASKPIKHAGQIIEILLSHRADPSIPSVIDDNSTPLLGAVKSYKSNAVISALVDAGASPTAVNNKGETPEQVATKRNNHAQLQAMLPRSKRASERLPVLLMLSGLMLSIIGWANMNVMVATVATVDTVATVAAVAAAAAVATVATVATAAAGLVTVGLVANAIKKRFRMSGVFDSLIPTSLQTSGSVEQFKKNMCDYINETNLSRFFPPGNKFLERVVEKAVELEADPNNILDVRDLTRLALYQPVLYCDDSGSMKRDRRNEHQNELVQRITSITTRLVPDDEGIELRFINQATNLSMSKPSLDTINGIMKNLSFNGWTEIGTNLKRKVLEEIVYSPLKNQTFKRPVLISIITDGRPEGDQKTREKENTLKDAILECGKILKEHGYDPKVVRFQISQIGSDKKAEKFLTGLDSDPELRDVLYCTAERLDDKFQNLRDNDTRLEQWLLELLMGPILEANSD